jgi:predicted DNA-binding protein
MKDQQQTLSVRISDALRRRLENAREMFGRADGDSMSISEVAKRFLESAKDDYIEASELMGRPTETLLNLRSKWERGQSISRAEWQVLGCYLQEGCESHTEGPPVPNPESYAVLLEAFVAAHALLRSGKNHELDYEYLWNLVREPLSLEMDVKVEAIIKAARDRIRELREPSAAARKWAPVFVGRNLRFLFGDERLKAIEALNEKLRPYLPVLFRIAARGHYLREGRPVREQHVERDYTQARPPAPRLVSVGDSNLSISIADNNEFSMLLDLEPQRVLYPLEPYPVIREFAAMLKELQPGESWRSKEFFGYTAKGPTAFNFRRRGNGIVVAFSAEEWQALGEMMDKALALPEMQPVLEDAALAYGEI